MGQIRDVKERFKESWGNDSQATAMALSQWDQKMVVGGGWWEFLLSLMTLSRSLVLVNTFDTASCWNLEEREKA